MAPIYARSLLDSGSETEFKIKGFFILGAIACVILVGPILIMIVYGGWSKWILLAVVGLAALVTAASLGLMTVD